MNGLDQLFHNNSPKYVKAEIPFTKPRSGSVMIN